MASAPSHDSTLSFAPAGASADEPLWYGSRTDPSQWHAGNPRARPDATHEPLEASTWRIHQGATIHLDSLSFNPHTSGLFR
jgi:hypothetical protein